MGLLSKAEDKPVLVPVAAETETVIGSNEQNAAPSILDSMEKALRERLERLTPKSTAYTALSLLKAYKIFDTGVCLVLNNDVYSSYASVGLGIGSILIPREKIWNPKKRNEKYFKLDARKNLGLREAKKYTYWIFPLAPSAGDEAPWDTVMVLGVSNTSSFRPEAVIAILEGISDKILKKTDQENAEAAAEENLPEQAANWEELLKETKSGEAVEDETAAPQSGEKDDAEFISFAAETEPEEFALSEGVFEESEGEEITDEEMVSSGNGAASSEGGEAFAKNNTDLSENEAALSEAAAFDNKSKSGVFPPEETEETLLSGPGTAGPGPGGIFSGEDTHDSSPENTLREYNNIYPYFNCIVLALPSVVDHTEMTDFCSRVSGMIHHPGAVIPLPQGLPLILFPVEMDGELIAHRLSKTLHTEVILSFEAESAEDVFRRIESLSSE